MTPRLTAQLLIAMTVAALPPVLVAIFLGAVSGGPMAQSGLLAALLVGGTLVWAVVVAAVSSRFVSADTEAVLAVAERRESEPSLGSPAERLARHLDEQDRRLRVLAAEMARAPLSAGAGAVATHIVGMVRGVTRDPTWELVVMSDTPELPSGAYSAAEPGPIEDLHRWASVSATQAPTNPAIAIGPWGAFLLIPARGQEVRSAVLMAPWEGRQEPTGADHSLLALLAEQAAMAIDHALLYSRAREQAETVTRLSAIQKDFLRGVTHDLQSPLASISATAAELRGRLNVDAGDERALDAVEEQAARLRRMVRQLLTMSGIEAGAVRPRDDVFRVQPLLDRVLDALHLPGGRVVVESTGPDRLIVGDPDRVEQVLWAVLDNALKYSPATSTVSVRLQLDLDGGRPVERIAILDRGIGMDAETGRRAGEQFYRSDEARSVAPNGSGIGLYTSKALMALMGGSLALSGELGRGTTAVLTIPAELVGDDSIGPPDESPASLSTSGDIAQGSFQGGAATVTPARRDSRPHGDDTP